MSPTDKPRPNLSRPSQTDYIGTPFLTEDYPEPQAGRPANLFEKGVVFLLWLLLALPFGAATVRGWKTMPALAYCFGILMPTVLLADLLLRQVRWWREK